MMNNLTPTAFNWLINESSLWPPRGRPEAPFGPTAIEIMRSCTLRIYFEYSKGYERRTAYEERWADVERPGEATDKALHQDSRSIRELTRGNHRVRTSYRPTSDAY